MRLSSLRQRVRGEEMLLAFMAAAVAARIAFWVISNRMFEDGLTTVTHARNVPLGLGLVHHYGEGHVHGFTSAIGVLVPLIGELIHEGSGIFAIRIASLVAVCVALLYAHLICRDLGLGTFPTAFVLAYLSFDQNMIFYGMAGMETQMAVAIILGGVYHVRRSEVIGSGIWLGLAPLARPEFVLWVAPALLYLALRNPKGVIVRIAAIAGAIVVPWVVFAYLYYGSPIPNTIVAKSATNPIPAILTEGSPLPWMEWLAHQFGGHVALLLAYLEPFREVWSTAAAPLPTPVLWGVVIAMVELIVVGLLATRRIPGFWPVTLFLALFFAYRVYFLGVVLYSDWYMPPFLALLVIVAAIGLHGMSAFAPQVQRALAAILSLAFAIHMPFSFMVESRVQAIEGEVRANAGQYLKATVRPGESVVSESAGYIGFYGETKLYDYPGLTSPTSVHALQKMPVDKRHLLDLVAALQPDWIVLRPWELDGLRQEFPSVASMYVVDRVFEAPGVAENELNQDANLVSFGGFAEIDHDKKIVILRRAQP